MRVEMLTKPGGSDRIEYGEGEDDGMERAKHARGRYLLGDAFLMYRYSSLGDSLLSHAIDALANFQGPC
jgi:hypothetical protein